MMLAEGLVVTPLCSISSDARLGRNACVNTMSIVGHDVQVGENTVVSSMVNIGGACVIGANCYLGMGALIKEGVRIGSNSIVGMGSVVYSDIPDDVIALGNPARCVAWLANTFAKFGDSLHAGDVILPGAVHKMVPVQPGDVFRAEFAQIGAVTATFSRASGAAA